MAVTMRAVGSSSVAAVSLKALLSASDQAATALATAMRTQSFVIIENDVSEHADMSLLYTTIRPEGGGPECSDGARIVAEAEEAAQAPEGMSLEEAWRIAREEGIELLTSTANMCVDRQPNARRRICCQCFSH